MKAVQSWCFHYYYHYRQKPGRKHRIFSSTKTDSVPKGSKIYAKPVYACVPCSLLSCFKIKTHPHPPPFSSVPVSFPIGALLFFPLYSCFPSTMLLVIFHITSRERGREQDAILLHHLLLLLIVVITRMIKKKEWSVCDLIDYSIPPHVPFFQFASRPLSITLPKPSFVPSGPIILSQQVCEQKRKKKTAPSVDATASAERSPTKATCLFAPH